MIQNSIHASKRILNNEINISNENIEIDYDSIYRLYKEEFAYYCENILLKSRNEILNTLYEKISSIINYYNKYQKKEYLNVIIKKCENDFISNEYIPMHNSISLTLSMISKNLNIKSNMKYSLLSKKINYINNFLPHCLNHIHTNEFAIHICGEKLIQIHKNIFNSKSKDKNNNKKKYVLCPKCKKCYKNKLILMSCNYCKKNYYSKLLKEEEKNNNIFPATWEKYHCPIPENNNDINNYKYEKQMPCIKCGSKLWIKGSNLFCKSCKFEIEPINLVWKCFNCDKEFRTNAKIYNNLKVKIIKHIIRDAFIQQKIVKPIDLPCDCSKKYKFENFNFYHRKEGRCNGVLYYNNFNGKDYVICSICKYICILNDFNWFCPFCLKYFISNKIQILTFINNNHNLYIRKNILENKPKKNKYFSPNPTNIFLNLKYSIDENDKKHSDINILSASQKYLDKYKNFIYRKNLLNLEENCIYYKNKNQNSIDKNINSLKNSQLSTLYNSYQKEVDKKKMNYNKKVYSCDNSLDNNLKTKFSINSRNKNIGIMPKSSNLSIYVSNRKIHSKFMISKKLNNSITKFNLNEKEAEDKNNNFMLELNKEKKDIKIKLEKPKIKISSSLMNIVSDREEDKEKNKLTEYLEKNKILEINRRKRNEINSNNKLNSNLNNIHLTMTINNFNKRNKKNIINSNYNNKTQNNFSKNEKLIHVYKNNKLGKIMNKNLEILNNINKISNKFIKQKSCEK